MSKPSDSNAHTGTHSRPVLTPRFLGPGEGEQVQVVTDLVRILADTASTGGMCNIFESRTMPGGGPPLHRHSVDDEFFFILHGRFEFVLDGRRFVAEPGAFLVAPRGSTHTFTNAGSGPGRMLVITMPGGLDGPFREAAAAVVPQAAPDPAVLGRIFGRHGIEFLGPPLGGH
jgi:mannose-6-phosphate isomerase-like protein (cupin superfamily)